jgi:hypothetical protein
MGKIKTPYFIDISSKIGSLIQLILYFLFGQKVKQKAHHKNQIHIFIYAKSHAYRLKNLNFAILWTPAAPCFIGNGYFRSKNYQ